MGLLWPDKETSSGEKVYLFRTLMNRYLILLSVLLFAALVTGQSEVVSLSGANLRLTSDVPVSGLPAFGLPPSVDLMVLSRFKSTLWSLTQ